MPFLRWKATCPMPDCTKKFIENKPWSTVTPSAGWEPMEDHFWSMHLNEANPDYKRFIPDDGQRHPIKMTQAHKQTVVQTQEQEEWPSDDEAPAAPPKPTSEDGTSQPWNPGTPASSDPCLNNLVCNLISSANQLADYARRTTASSAVRRRSRSPRQFRRSRSISPSWRQREATWTARGEERPW